MTTCFGKSCSFGLPCVSFVSFINLCFEDGMWDLILLHPDHFLSFYFHFDSDSV